MQNDFTGVICGTVPMRPLGNTGIEVSGVAFGGVEIGLSYGIYKDQRLDDSQAISLLHNAIDGGINFFDTARLYGRSEEIMGKAFDGIRDKVVICTKSRHLRDKDGNIFKGKALEKHVEDSIVESLKMLRTDYIDVFMAHSVDKEILLSEEVAEVFENYKRKGFVRSIGASTYGLESSQIAIEDGRWNVIQLVFNMMDQSCGALFPMAKQNGVGIMVRSVLMRGLLADPNIRLHEKLKCIEQHRLKYFDLLCENAPTLSDLATKFVLAFQDIATVLVGIDKMEFLQKAIKLAGSSPLSADTVEKIKKLAYPEYEFLDLHTWDVNGWLT